MTWRLIRWVVAGIAVSTEIAAFVVWRRSQRFVADATPLLSRPAGSGAALRRS
jgi:hypothetical protein